MVINYTVIHFIFVQIFFDKNFCVKYFRMVYENDCSIRVIRSYAKNFHVEIFLHTKIILQQKKANYGSASETWMFFQAHYVTLGICTEMSCELLLFPILWYTVSTYGVTHCRNVLSSFHFYHI